MKPLLAAYFFHLRAFEHAPLFEESEYVWEVLPKIKSYLSSCSLGKIEGRVDARAVLVDPHLISIGAGSVVEAGAYIQGPCIIGKKCQIRHGAYIRGDCITGDQCIIGHATEVKNALFLEGAHAGHFAYVGDSILGQGVNLGAGVKCANLRLDKKNIFLSYRGLRIETGLRKFGAILGDGVSLGCNAVTNPGTLMGRNSHCYPCVTVGGFIPENEVIKSSLFEQKAFV